MCGGSRRGTASVVSARWRSTSIRTLLPAPPITRCRSPRLASSTSRCGAVGTPPPTGPPSQALAAPSPSTASTSHPGRKELRFSCASCMLVSDSGATCSVDGSLRGVAQQSVSFLGMAQPSSPFLARGLSGVEDNVAEPRRSMRLGGLTTKVRRAHGSPRAPTLPSLARPRSMSVLLAPTFLVRSRRWFGLLSSPSKTACPATLTPWAQIRTGQRAGWRTNREEASCPYEKRLSFRP